MIDVEIGHCRTINNKTITYACHTLGYGNGCQTLTPFETMRFNRENTIRDDNRL